MQAVLKPFSTKPTVAPAVVSASRAAWQCVQNANQWKLSWGMMTATDSKTNEPSATHNWQRNMTGKGG
jgi:hypothetical protein